MQKLRNAIVTLLSLTSLLVAPALLATPVHVAAACPPNLSQAACDACNGIGVAGGDCNSDSGGQQISNVIQTVIRILSAVVGAVAVIMIVVAGFKYMTAAGEASKIASAKSTLIYAIIGLIIVAMAQIIVHVVIRKV
jgi:hypothetical protein